MTPNFSKADMPFTLYMREQKKSPTLADLIQNINSYWHSQTVGIRDIEIILAKNGRVINVI